MKLYTKTGDKGETSLFTGQRVPKNDLFVEALGSVDECNSSLGAAIAFFKETKEMKEIKDQLEIIQHALFDVGAAIATPRTTASSKKLEKTRFDSQEIEILEKWIDKMEEELPPLQAFILPGGHPSGALLHVSRSICRRAERRVLPLYIKGDVTESVIIYLNRLSDYLFSVSRYVNFLNQSRETEWMPHKLSIHLLA